MRAARRVKLVFDDSEDDEGKREVVVGAKAGSTVSARETAAAASLKTTTTTRTTAATTVTGTGNVSVQGQKHFYMETQSCLADPLSNGKGHMLVHSACQVIGLMRAELALQLRKLLSRVEVRNTQVGGAYGGKAFYPVQIAVSCC